MKKIRYMAEAALLHSAFRIFYLLGPDKASAAGGWIGRALGPHLSASRKAFKNLQLAMPEKTAEEHEAIVRKMWDNLGRVIGEYPHMQRIITERIDVAGEENLDAIGIDNPCIIIGAHLANWEIPAFFFNYRKKWPVNSIYREPNNPYVARLLTRARNPEQRGRYIAKSQQGVREMVKTLKDGGRLGNLIDQKYNQGLPVPFFGHPAMTSAAPVQLAEKFGCPILPMQVERLKGCNFRVTFYPAFKTEGIGDMAAMEKCHSMLEDWIRQNPEQWLWLHRRWNSRALRQNAAL